MAVGASAPAFLDRGDGGKMENPVHAIGGGGHRGGIGHVGDDKLGLGGGVFAASAGQIVENPAPGARAPTKVSARWEPMKPQPPVTR